MDMATDNVPEYLYHYTDIDTLALILKHHTIRLNSLDKMDDKQEQMSKDRQNFGKFVFVSSWTDDAVESIPMWRMYTPKGRGVRIKLKTNPFESYPMDAKAAAQALNISNIQDNGKPSFNLIIPTQTLFNSQYTIFNYSENQQLAKVLYTDDEEILNPSVLYLDEDGARVELSRLGWYKNTYWSFQKEWRYRLLITPIKLNVLMKKGVSGDYGELADFIQTANRGMAALPFNYYDLRIRDDCYKDMSIMLSPDITESSKTIVTTLVEKYNQTCAIEPSELTNLI